MRLSYLFLDDQLVEYGCRVMNHRARLYPENWNTLVKKKHFDISDQLEESVNPLSTFCKLC